ncbi:MAG: hypothetical protein EBW87_00225 [Burkholderiaceae bacterium]|nr:hypothetical protein [Burkholderiaceae bacterium]
MALYSKKEFAALCGMNTRQLSVYINRNKVICRDDETIDDADPVNSGFVEIRKSKGKSVRVVAKKQAKKTVEKSVDSAGPSPGSELLELEKRRKTSDLELKEQEKALKQLQILKAQGKVVPTDLVRNLFSVHFKETHLGFKQMIDVLISEIGQKYRLNANQIAELRAKSVELLNKIIEKNVENSKRSVETLVVEFSAK